MGLMIPRRWEGEAPPRKQGDLGGRMPPDSIPRQSKNQSFTQVNFVAGCSGSLVSHGGYLVTLGGSPVSLGGAQIYKILNIFFYF